MNKVWRSVWVLGVLGLLLTGCAGLQPGFEKPQVNLTALRPLPSSGFEQRFEVQLRVVNPNSRALPVQGMSYTLFINDIELATGVSSDIPAIGAYQEVQLTLPVSTQIISVLRLVSDVVSSGRDSVDYNLEARIDTGMTLMPHVTVSEAGSMSLSDLRPPGRSIAL
ncbi:LEA type 2 family protein [Pseudomaricurvus sp. HS19]|uniref:LEA type 2 family protein n=1 Tax=Pseudomaricurvus sp. HS19 TaxID=2692626 RepID=UPI001369A6C9|nr:LEA type 2 family protein [Pseudomaricurvus sp. HS19]MYM62649.1 hypothetical protein [Pseudomaricurvus sp. HS19]